MNLSLSSPVVSEEKMFKNAGYTFIFKIKDVYETLCPNHMLDMLIH